MGHPELTGTVLAGVPSGSACHTLGGQLHESQALLPHVPVSWVISTVSTWGAASTCSTDGDLRGCVKITSHTQKWLHVLRSKQEMAFSSLSCWETLPPHWITEASCCGVVSDLGSPGKEANCNSPSPEPPAFCILERSLLNTLNNQCITSYLLFIILPKPRHRRPPVKRLQSNKVRCTGLAAVQKDCPPRGPGSVPVGRPGRGFSWV